ncbi:uncharacterized protein LOC120357008 [Solenopsis invicta]|uniref:uncharacterized protein LOC120357008 n=1 Tax=Solenopsis invicta TaxID=13686 RepID=UPI00193E9771|nr:uncharacterized protein LOC120357008 [Solenopsis invicta]
MDKYFLKKSKQPNLNVELATSFSLDAFNSNMSTTSTTNAISKLTSNSKKSTLANARSVSSISEEKNKQAVKKKFALPNNQNSQTAKKAFVTTRFTLWKNAYLSLPKHKKSELHRAANELLLSSKSVSVVQHMSVANQKTMMENRIALKKIFCTIRVLALQGLSLRGNGSNKRSNFNEILQARSEDILELRAWLHRKGHKWTSHDIQNEILELMASNIKQQNLKEIKAAHFFAFTLDETSDIARLEQVSISIRIVSDNLSIREIFWGFYDTKNTKSETIYAFVKHEEPRAVFVHCNAHRLNLVVQDAIEDATTARNFVGVIKDLITFIRDFPKRLAEYKGFQEAVLKEDDEENLGKALTIAPYCPTRWCMRVFLLKTLQQKINYMAVLQFLGAMKMNREVDSSISSKAAGFLKHLESFEFYFQLTMIVKVFEKIELLNKELQESNLCALEKWMLS